MKINKAQLKKAKKLKKGAALASKLSKPQLKLAALFCLIAGILIGAAILLKGDQLKLGDIYPLKDELHRWLALVATALIVILLEIYLYIKIKKYDASEDEAELSDEEKQILALDTFNNLQLQLAYKDQENKGFFKNHRLYKKPWFIVLGGDGDNAELINALSTEAFYKKPSKFDDSLVQWAFTPSAALLTIKETLWNHQDDLHQSLWFHFNSWILEQRSKRPINGIVLTIDVEQLIRKDNASSPSISAIKAKLALLNKTFGNQVPVYLSISQLNKLEGFDAYRKWLSDNQLSSPFGVSLTFNQENQNFDQQFEALENTFNASLMQNITASNAEDNQLAYLFIREFIGLKKTLYELSNTLGATTPPSENLIIRGIYFTAEKATSSPILPVIKSTVSANYDLPNDSEKRDTTDDSNKHLYFTQKLLSAVLLPESGIADNNIEDVTQRRNRLITAYVVTGSIIALLFTGWLYFYKKNQFYANQSLDLIQGYQRLDQASVANKSEPLHLETLDILRASMIQNQEQSFMPVSLREMGMDIKPEIQKAEEQTYRRILSNDFLPVLINQQITQLENRVGNSQKTKLHSEDIEQLKIIRLLNIQTDKLNQTQKNKVNNYRKQLVFPWMETFWKHHYKNYNQVEGSLRQHLDYVIENNIQSKQNTRIAQRITALQNHEQDLPTDEKVYAQIKKQIATDNPTPLHLEHHLGTKLFQVYKKPANNTALTIPYLYTQQGFAAYKAIDYKELLKSFSFDSWALGKNNHLQNYSDLDILQLKKQVKEHYISDYESAWQAAINTLNIKHFQSSNDALIFLDALAGKDSPYKKFLLQVQENTLLPLPKAAPPAKDKKDAAKVPPAPPSLTDEQKIEKDIALSIKASFEFINELSEKGEDGKSYMDGVFKTVKAIQKNLKKITTPKKKPAKAPPKPPAADPVETLLDMSSTVTDPFQSQFQQIALNSQALFTQHTKTDINQAWQKTVHSFYSEKLKGKYPLVKSGQDASLDDFQAFFGKDGILDKFYAKHLSKVFGKKSDKETFNHASPVLEMYQHALFIQQAFFNDAGDYEVKFTVEPTVLSNTFLNSILNLEGVKIPYQHDETKPLNLVWPSKSKEKNKSSLTINPMEKNTKNFYIVTEGEWAFFHLLDKSKTHALKDRERNIRFKQGGGLAGYKLTVPASISPLTKDVFAGFDIPPTLQIPAP